jgi:cytochrome c553
MIDHGNDPQFAEPVIDSLKEQKMRELENVREALKKKRANQSISIQYVS